MKLFSKTVLIAYLLILLWLILFKFSADIPGVFDTQIRSFNVIPFAGVGDHLREMLDNFVVFIPLGLLLSVNFKHITMWRKLTYIFALSAAVEMIQFILAIGVADLTDVIVNTLGGLFGLALYDSTHAHVNHDKRDKIILVMGTILLIGVVLLRFLVLRVRY
jgi:glycopeptide antibiotics resistance protein